MDVRKCLFALLFLLCLWLAGKFLLPLLFPFVLGAGIALAAEPAVRLGVTRLRLPRGAAAGAGVTLTLVLLLGIALALGALLVRELGSFAGQLPQMAQQSADLLEDALTSLCEKAPGAVEPMLTSSVHRFFQDGTILTDQALQKIPGLLSGLLEKLPGSAMGIGTGLLSGYFISARLPWLKNWLSCQLPPAWNGKFLPALRHFKRTLGKWLAAQGKLMAITYGIVAVGLLLLGIPYALFWAALVAAVDAVPLLGTGTVLLPWALTLLLQGHPLTALWLVVLYLIAMGTRTVLEPRLYGRQLGFDPLVMLIFLYFGYRLWGFFGMILAPLLAAATKALSENGAS